MRSNGAVNLAGDLQMKVTRRQPILHPTVQSPTLTEIMRLGMPRFGLDPEVRRWRADNVPNLLRGLRDVALAKLSPAPTMIGLLYLTKLFRNGRTLHYGLASARVVTTAGVGYIVDAFQNSVELENMKYHGLGTGTNAEASGDTALQTELTTEYSSNNTRPTGTTTEGASANIYRTVGTITVDASVAATEHGIFSDPTRGSGVLLDRSVFSVINLVSGDAIQATYELTFTAGS